MKIPSCDIIIVKCQHFTAHMWKLHSTFVICHLKKPTWFQCDIYFEHVKVLFSCEIVILTHEKEKSAVNIFSVREFFPTAIFRCEKDKFHVTMNNFSLWVTSVANNSRRSNCFTSHHVCIFMMICEHVQVSTACCWSRLVYGVIHILHV